MKEPRFTQFISLSKERTRELEVTTTPWVMRLSQCSRSVDSDRILRLHDWNRYSNVDIYSSLYKKVDAISEKLGLGQTFYVNYSGVRNAVWGLDYNGDEFLLYYSSKGMALQVASNISCKGLLHIVDVIAECWNVKIDNLVT
jgi:hypothetical protein